MDERPSENGSVFIGGSSSEGGKSQNKGMCDIQITYILDYGLRPRGDSWQVTVCNYV